MFKKEKEQVAVTEPETAAESEFPKKGGSGGGSGRGYTVEARLNFNGASEIINGIALGPTWATLHFPEAPIGVPKGAVCWGYLPHTSLLAYPSAQALRWWFLANAEVSRAGGTLCIETRLVQHDCTYSFAETPVAAVDATGRE